MFSMHTQLDEILSNQQLIVQNQNEMMGRLKGIETRLARVEKNLVHGGIKYTKIKQKTIKPILHKSPYQQAQASIGSPNQAKVSPMSNYKNNSITNHTNYNTNHNNNNNTTNNFNKYRISPQFSKFNNNIVSKQPNWSKMIKLEPVSHQLGTSSTPKSSQAIEERPSSDNDDETGMDEGEESLSDEETKARMSRGSSGASNISKMVEAAGAAFSTQKLETSQATDDEADDDDDDETQSNLILFHII